MPRPPSRGLLQRYPWLRSEYRSRHSGMRSPPTCRWIWEVAPLPPKGQPLQLGPMNIEAGEQRTAHEAYSPHVSFILCGAGAVPFRILMEFSVTQDFVTIRCASGQSICCKKAGVRGSGDFLRAVWPAAGLRVLITVVVKFGRGVYSTVLGSKSA